MSYLGQQLGQGQAERWVCTATAGQTTITVGDDGRSISYTPPQVDVYLNGSKQVVGSDVTATTGTSLVFASGLTAGDVVDVVALSVFNAADMVSKSLGGTFLGAVNFPSGGLNVGSGQLKVDSSGRVTMSSQPAFEVNITSSVACPSTYANIPFNNAVRNNGSHFNTSTGIFTAPVSGVYHFSFNALYYPAAEGILVDLKWVKNGAGIQDFQCTAPAGSHFQRQISNSIYLSANDTFSIQHRTTGTTNLYAGQTYYSGVLLG